MDPEEVSLSTYEEMLYEICYPVGLHEHPVGQESMFTYLQNAFGMPVQEHMNLLKVVKARKPPHMKLNIDVIEAKNLPPKDSNGLADPFVSLNLASDDSPNGTYETEVKSETLRPVWNEKCSFTIEKEVSKEVLKIQVWDYDPAETTGEKLQKIYDVKDIKGFGRFLKEVVGPTGKEVNELMGSVDIPLLQVPTKGIKQWYVLHKADKIASLGEVHIGLSFGSLRNSKTIDEEHRILVKRFLHEQLQVTKSGQYQCDGKFCAQASNLLTQHAIQGGLNETDTAFLSWTVFCEVHKSHRLSFVAFNSLLDQLIPYMERKLGADEEKRAMFWSTLIYLMVTIFDWLKDFQISTSREKEDLEILRHMLEFLDKVEKMKLAKSVDLFPKHFFGFLYEEDFDGTLNIELALKITIQQTAKQWFEHQLNTQNNSVTTQEEGILGYIKLVETVRSDFEKAVELVDIIFLRMKNFKYAHHLFQVYDQRLDEVVKPYVTAICCNLAPIDASITNEADVDKLVGKSIFTLFMELRWITSLGQKVSGNNEELMLKNCHNWFLDAVHHWLDASVYKAKLRLAKAIKLDNLQPLDDGNRHSTSAMDTVLVFFQVFKFWQDLEWPEPTSGYTFVRKIIEEICACTSLYTKKMTLRVDAMKQSNNSDSSSKFEVTKEWCCAINNLDYMRKNLKKMIEDFCLETFIKSLPESDRNESSIVLNSIISQALEREQASIGNFIDEIAARMAPNLKLYLSDGAAHLHEDYGSMDKMMAYLEESLTMLNAELSIGNFERIMDKMWLEICRILECKTKFITGEPQPLLYANLLKAVNLLLENFQCQHENNEDCLCRDALDKITKKLQLYGYATDELIHQFYVDRLQAQNALCETSKYGSLTVQCSFEENTLKVNIMNAKDLIPPKTGSSTNVFVKIYLLPANKFQNIKVSRTKPVKDTLFPMFDEEFEISLTDEEKSVENALLMIRLKDKKWFGFRNHYMADCFISFDQIMANNDRSQIQLPLHRPMMQEFACIEALSFRKSDRKAQILLKKLNAEKCELQENEAE